VLISLSTTNELLDAATFAQDARALPLKVRKPARQLANAKWDRQAPSAPQKPAV